jgi:hypothetical protein
MAPKGDQSPCPDADARRNHHEMHQVYQQTHSWSLRRVVDASTTGEPVRDVRF